MSQDAKSSLLSEQMQVAVSEFARQHANMADPEQARGSCSLISGYFIFHLLRHDLQGASAHCMDGDISLHVVNVVAGSDGSEVVVDFTARQFDPNAPFPLIERARTFFADYEHVEEGTNTLIESDKLDALQLLPL